MERSANNEDAPPPPLACPVCHDTMDVAQCGGMRLFPCAHAACAGCVARLPRVPGNASRVACPMCREECDVDAVERHQPLDVLSVAHHCPGCARRWDGERCRPMLLRPCLHQLCTDCANNSRCAVCDEEVEGRAMDDAYHHALTTGRLAPPRPELTRTRERAAGGPAAGGLAGAMLAFCRWVQQHPAVLEMDWTYTAVRPQNQWPADKKRLYNRVAELSMEVGYHVPLTSGIDTIGPTTVAQALGLSGPLGSMVELEVSKTRDMRRARMRFTEDVRASLHALPRHPHYTLPL